MVKIEYRLDLIKKLSMCIDDETVLFTFMGMLLEEESIVAVGFVITLNSFGL